MHPDPAFRQMPEAFARLRGFGTLAVNDGAGPLLSHVPFLLSEDGKTAELHLVRSNPIVRLLDAPRPAAIAVQGPDGSVSPDWYGVEDQVPTWNYVAVHLRGQLEVRPQAGLHDMLARLSAAFEARLGPKRPWTSARMAPGTMERMMRMFVPCRLTVAEVPGTRKLSQNKTTAARLSAAAEIGAAGVGAETTLLAAWMHED